MPTMAPRSAPCSTKWVGRWRPSPAMAPTTATMSMPRSRPAILMRPSWCRHARMRCRAKPQRAHRRSATGISQAITEHGRMAWQKASGYNWRALVEADIARWKRVVGDGLRLQTDGRQATEVAIAAEVLNRMLDLGRPEYVRTA